MPVDLVLAALNKPISDLTVDDIKNIATGGVPEDIQTEFKSMVPGGSWGPNSTNLRQDARDGLLKEIVAFANALGGTLYVGIKESDDDPKRSAFLTPVPAVAKLAAVVAEIMRSSVDPRILSPQIKTVISDAGTGEGVLVVRVEASPTAPHWNKAERRCYRRVGSSSQSIEMLEMQQITLQKSIVLEQADAKFQTRSSKLDADYRRYSDLRLNTFNDNGRNPSPPICGYAIRATAVPVGQVRLSKNITARPDLKIGSLPFPVRFADGRKNGSLVGRSSASVHHFRPALRAWIAEQMVDYRQELTIQADGLIENTVMDIGKELPPDDRFRMILQTNFIFFEIFSLIMRVERFKHRVGCEGVAYELEMEIRTRGNIQIYLSTAVGEQPGVFKFSTNHIVFPRVLYEGRSQLPEVTEAVQYDVFNAMGRLVDDFVPPFFIDVEDRLWEYIDSE